MSETNIQHISPHEGREGFKCIYWLQIISGFLIVVLIKVGNKDIFKNG